MSENFHSKTADGFAFRLQAQDGRYTLGSLHSNFYSTKNALHAFALFHELPLYTAEEIPAAVRAFRKALKQRVFPVHTAMHRYFDGGRIVTHGKRGVVEWIYQ